MSLSRSDRSALVLTLLALVGASPALAAPTSPQGQANLAGVRMPFVANEGQTDARVAYYAPTFAGTVFVTRRGEVVYALRGPSPRPDGGRAGRVSKPTEGWSLTETLPGGGRPQPTAGPIAETQVSLFLGDDPAQHRSALPTYASIGLGEVWPGVTVALHAVGASVEKHFTVEPGASPGRIRVRVAGATALRLNVDGTLAAQTGLGAVTFTAPIAYQEVEGLRRPVDVAYRLHGREYGFALGAYDRSRPLVIDPILQSTFLGGSGDEAAFFAALAIHPTTGDVYVAGDTSSTVFPGTAGGARPTKSGGVDAFVARLNSALTTLIQSTFFGGSGLDAASSVAIHPVTGDVYVAGTTDSATLPGTAGGAQTTNPNPNIGDVFIARFNSALTTLTQSTFLGGRDNDSARALAIHPTTGEVYVAGRSSDLGFRDFPGKAGGAQSTFGGGFSDAFVARLNSALTTLIQSTYVGGNFDDEAFALAIHPATGNVYVAGRTDSTTFPGTAGGPQTTNGGSIDGFVARLNSALTILGQSTFLGGSCLDEVHALAIHPATGDVYVAGFTDSTTFPGTAGGAQTSNGGGTDAFVARLNSALTALTQSTFLGGGGNDSVSALAFHPTTGDVYVAGGTSSSPFPGTSGGAQACLAGTFDAFVTRLNSALTTLTQSTFLGGSGIENASALAFHPTTVEVYVAGFTSSPTFPGAAGGAQTSNAGGFSDAFVTRLTADLTGPLPDLTIAKTHGGNFSQGQTGAAYTLTVSNIAGAACSTVTVTDTVPAGLTATAIGGTGWTCTQPGGPCTRGDTLLTGASYPALTLTVNVAGNAPASVTNTAAVSGGGDGNPANNTANDPTTITPTAGGGVPDLTIAKTHAGNFTQGQTGATYTLTVTNSGTGPTSGTVTVTETVPAGLTAIAISGTGWACTQPSGPCTRSDALAAGASYPAITLTVNVAGNAPGSVINSATVAGGGQVNTTNDGQSDPTTILPPGAVVPIPVMSSFGWALMVALLIVTAMATLRGRRGPRAGASR